MPLEGESGTTARNYSGANGDGSYGGTYALASRVTVPGRLSADFTNGYANHSALSLGGLTGLTLEAWVVVDAFTGSGGQYISSVWGTEAAGPAEYALLRCGQDGTAGTQTAFNFAVGTSGVAANCVTANGAAVAGNRYHLVGAWAPGAGELWVNGVLVASESASTGTTNSYSGSWRAAYNPNTPARLLDGGVAWVATYNTKLSAARIRAHYQAGIRTGVVVG